MLRLLAPTLVLAALAAGCAPRLAPLYRDYAVPGATAGRRDTDSTLVRAAAAFTAAGWSPADAPAGTLATAPRDGTDWGLYRMKLSLVAYPLGAGHVRVRFEPVRDLIGRDRTHVPYLPSGLRSRFTGDLDRAMQAQGLKLVASGGIRDRIERKKAR